MVGMFELVDCCGVEVVLVVDVEVLVVVGVFGFGCA